MWLPLCSYYFQVELTWDETDPDRVKMTQQEFDKDKLEELDLKNYLASDSDTDNDGGEWTSMSSKGFFALPNPLSCSVMNKICLNQCHLMYADLFLVVWSELKHGCHSLHEMMMHEYDCLNNLSHIRQPSVVTLYGSVKRTPIFNSHFQANKQDVFIRRHLLEKLDDKIF